jgi:hypothetical protein
LRTVVRIGLTIRGSEAGDRDVVGDTQPAFPRGVNSADSHQVVKADGVRTDRAARR